jgi:hypothetical protein
MLTRKDFRAMAEIINTQTGEPGRTEYEEDYDRGWDDATRRLAENLAEYLAKQNPRFDRERFLKACGL